MYIYIYIYVCIYICYGFQLVNQFNQVSYGYICHSFSYNNITNWKDWKGIPKKKKTHTHTFFFNEESTINDTLRVGVKSFNEESTLNDTYK